MELIEYWHALAKRWWMILLVAFVAAAAAYSFSKLQEPIFRSSAKLYVMPARPDYGNALFSQAVVRQYSQLVASDKFLKSVSESMKLDLAESEMRNKVITSGRAEDLVIQIDVTDTDAGRARAIAREVARLFTLDQDARMKDINRDNRIDVRMYDEPSVPVLNSPKTRVNVVAGSVFGLMLGILLAFLLEYLDDTIKSSEDVDRYVALPVMGTIPSFTP
ncbi:MAG: lipopolysaccharide biosynthesis protein [Dehalococcoidia bacterium]|nr:lipopolysaccharide biosynthesis protein [Dehalococcoidia bacterium]